MTRRSAQPTSSATVAMATQRSRHRPTAPNAAPGGGLRCPCHNLPFATRGDLRHHMSPTTLSTIGVANYQEWMDTLDVQVPLPQLAPRVKSRGMQRPTVATRERVAATEQSAQELWVRRQSPPPTLVGIGSPSSTTLDRPPKTARPGTPLVDAPVEQKKGPTTAREKKKGASGAPVQPSATTPPAAEEHQQRPVNNPGLVSLKRPRQRTALWVQAFDEEPQCRAFLQYVLSYGSVQQQDQYVPPHFTRPVHRALLRLFACIDRADRGRFDLDDLCAAAKDAFGSLYAAKHFTRLDQGHTGSIDFIGLCRLFFPHTSSKRLVAAHQQFQKPPERVPTTRELLSAADAASIDALFDRIDRRPGGCTFENLLLELAPTAQDHRATYRPLFAQLDRDDDGVIERDDFLELVKYTYPPFRAPRLGPSGSGTTAEQGPDRISAGSTALPVSARQTGNKPTVSGLPRGASVTSRGSGAGGDVRVDFREVQQPHFPHVQRPNYGSAELAQVKFVGQQLALERDLAEAMVRMRVAPSVQKRAEEHAGRLKPRGSGLE